MTPADEFRSTLLLLLRRLIAQMAWRAQNTPDGSP